MVHYDSSHYTSLLLRDICYHDADKLKFLSLIRNFSSHAVTYFVWNCSFNVPTIFLSRWIALHCCLTRIMSILSRRENCIVVTRHGKCCVLRLALNYLLRSAKLMKCRRRRIICSIPLSDNRNVCTWKWIYFAMIAIASTNRFHSIVCITDLTRHTARYIAKWNMKWNDRTDSLKIHN